MNFNLSFQNTHSPSNYVAKVNETLKILYDNIPNAFVNLVEIFDIKPLAQVAQGFFCRLVTRYVHLFIHFRT